MSAPVAVRVASEIALTSLFLCAANSGPSEPRQSKALAAPNPVTRNLLRFIPIFVSPDLGGPNLGSGCPFFVVADAQMVPWRARRCPSPHNKGMLHLVRRSRDDFDGFPGDRDAEAVSLVRQAELQTHPSLV